MKVTETSIPDVKLVEPRVFGDQRGFFLESWNDERYSEKGLDVKFVQDNVSFSKKGILRGLHLQNPRSQGKLVNVLQGEVFDVAVDVRVGSPYFGRWVGACLSSENHHQLYIPAGFAHGFCVMSDTALFSYKCTEYYDPSTEFSISWDDADLQIKWPILDPTLSEKDQNAFSLSDVPTESLPRFSALAPVSGSPIEQDMR